MNILEISATAEMALRKKANARTFAEFTRATAMRWTPDEAKYMGISPRAIRAVEDRRNNIGKSAVDAGSTATGNWANALASEYRLAADFLGSLSGISVFDTMFPSMIPVPLKTIIGFVSAGGTGAQVQEGQVKKLTDFSLGNTPIDELKAVAMIAFTKELLKLSSFNATKLFQSELEKCVSAVTDSQFISILTDGISTIPSSGSTVSAARHDLRAAVSTIEGSAQSQYFILMPSVVCKALAFSIGENGAEAFPDLGPKGGLISKTPVLVTDSISGKIVAVDAAQIVANQGTVETRSAQHASLQFDNAPDSPPTASTVGQSLWQEGKMALMAERYFCAARIRSTAVAVISGVNYTGDSPT